MSVIVKGEDVREVASQIKGICRALGARWMALASDMNIGVPQRLEAAHKAAKLNSTADALGEITDDAIDMALKLAEAGMAQRVVQACEALQSAGTSAAS